MSIASKCKNPANIRVSKDSWLGKVGSEKGFVKFVDEIYGIRALIRLLQNYIKHDICTIDTIISRFAPNSENDTQAYISFVKEFFITHGINIDTSISPNEYSFYILCCAITKYESNYNLTRNEYNYVLERFKL